MFEEAAPTGTGTPIPLHQDRDELTYVFKGEVAFKISGKITIDDPGTCAFVPRGVAHAWTNIGSGPGLALFAARANCLVMEPTPVFSLSGRHGTSDLMSRSPRTSHHH